jgi:hypothetical protein
MPVIGPSWAGGATEPEDCTRCPDAEGASGGRAAAGQRGSGTAGPAQVPLLRGRRLARDRPVGLCRPMRQSFSCSSRPAAISARGVPSSVVAARRRRRGRQDRPLQPAGGPCRLRRPRPAVEYWSGLGTDRRHGLQPRSGVSARIRRLIELLDFYGWRTRPVRQPRRRRGRSRPRRLRASSTAGRTTSCPTPLPASIPTFRPYGFRRTPRPASVCQQTVRQGPLDLPLAPVLLRTGHPDVVRRDPLSQRLVTAAPSGRACAGASTPCITANANRSAMASRPGRTRTARGRRRPSPPGRSVRPPSGPPKAPLP